MKKLFSFLLAAVMSLGMTASAFASEKNTALALTVGDEDGLSLQGALLVPETEYRFPLFLEENGVSRPLTHGDMEQYDLTVTVSSGKGAMAEAGYLESGRQMVLSLTGAAVSSAEPVTVSARVTLRDKKGAALSRLDLRWKVGYPAAEEESLGEVTRIDPAAPVLTGAQLSKIESITGSAPASFVGDGWQFDVRLLSSPAVNFALSTADIKAISEQWPEADFSFFRFIGKPSFDFSGQLTLDAPLFADETVCLYRYLDGVLYSLRFTDNGDGTLTVPTKALGTYVISDQKIPNGTAVTGYQPESGDDTENPPADKDNPSTGGTSSGIFTVLGSAVLFGIALTLAQKRASRS